MGKEKLDSYLLEPAAMDKFFKLTESEYFIKVPYDIEQNCREILDSPGGFCVGLFYNDPNSQLKKVIVFPGTSLEKFMQKNFEG